MATLSPLDLLRLHDEFRFYAVENAPGAFNLGQRTGGNRRPISIPYQIELARHFVEEAAYVGAIGADYPLLIFGGGATGAAAAITAAQNRIPCVLREASEIMFGPQARSATRWLHPFQYDWPELHWCVDRFPRKGSEPLGFSAAFAAEVASDWAKQFEECRASTDGLLNLQLNTEALAIPPTDTTTYPSAAEARIAYAARYGEFIKANDPAEEFAVYLLCTGFGAERCCLPPFTGFPFWSTDPVNSKDFGSRQAKPRILISGGGDGAQQDLLRLAFELPPITILSRVLQQAESVAGGRHWRRDFASRVRAIEKTPRSAGTAEKAGRAYHDLIFNIPAEIWGPVCENLQKTLRKEFDGTRVNFNFRSRYLPPCLPLNRVLTLMLRRLVLETENHDIFNALTAVRSSAEPVAPHRCQNDAASCWGQEHVVTLTTADQDRTSSFDIILVRHGV